MKIIVIGTLFKEKPGSPLDIESDDYYLFSWAGLWARRLKKRYPDIDIEVWRAEAAFTKITMRKAYNVDCTIFPYRIPLVPGLITLEMFRRLHQYQNKYNLIIHLTRIFDWRFNIQMPLLLPKTHFVLSHLGGVFPSADSIKNLFLRKLLRYSYKRIDTITYLRDSVKKEIASANKNINYIFLPVGADFKFFNPMDKITSRRNLGLPLDKTLAVYVGKFFRLKGVDHILNIYNHFKDNNFEVLLVGGNEKDELFSEVVSSGCRYWSYISREQLRETYSAADFYIHPAFHSEFGGLDIAWIEALACNKPVLSPQLKLLEFGYSDLGIALDNEYNMFEKAHEMIGAFSKFNKCRATAMVHLDGNTAIIDKLYNVFSNFSE